jgi:hypothetical protein
MDELMLFDRSNGISICLLCDGHGSRFKEPFLEYTCCIGVLCGASMWQVGDSVEQDGTFKIQNKTARSDTVTGKIRAGLPATLERSDIVRIMNVAWTKSFARIDTKKQATTMRGKVH